MLGLARTVIEGVVFDEDAAAIVVSVRPRKGARGPRRRVRLDQLVQPRTAAHLAADAVTTRLRADPQGATARSMTRVRHGGGCSLTHHQHHKLDWIAKTDPRLYRAYLLKEGLRYVFARQGRRRQRSPRPLDLLGPALSHPSRSSSCSDASSSHRAAIDAALDTRPVERTDRIDQHQDPPHHPRRLRLPRPRTPHRPRHAHPRRPPTRPPRPNMTHGCSQEDQNRPLPERDGAAPDRPRHRSGTVPASPPT